MNTWGYLILIAALILLAGVMLYARFVSRSREKSLHHNTPVEWVFPTEAISSAPAVATEPALIVLGDIPPDADRVEPELVSEPVLRLERAPISGSVDFAPEGEVSRDRDRHYFNELQEAAAGLAKLMRSSPVARVEPVVFAPIPEEKVAPEPSLETVALLETLEADIVEDVSLLTGESETMDQPGSGIGMIEDVVMIESELITDALEVVDESPVEITVPDEVPVRELTLREVLGEGVADQFDRIDEGLDALESLVAGIGSSLRALADLEAGDFGGDEICEGDPVAAVSVAA